MPDDRLYFRQLLSGRDFGSADRMAQQMVNFVYLIGDRHTGEAVIVDPAYDVAALLQVLESDGMRCTGVLATHYHPDHVGGSMMGFDIIGVKELLDEVSVPVHAQREEAEFIRKVTGLGGGDVVEHASGDVVRVGEIDIELIHTPGHTPGSQCFLVDDRLVAGDTLFLEGCVWSTTGWSPATRCSSRAAAAPTCRVATRRRCTRASPRSWPRCRTPPSCIPATCTRRSRRPRWATPVRTTSCSSHAPRSSGSPCSASRRRPEPDPPEENPCSELC